MVTSFQLQPDMAAAGGAAVDSSRPGPKAGSRSSNGRDDALAVRGQVRLLAGSRYGHGRLGW